MLIAVRAAVSFPVDHRDHNGGALWLRPRQPQQVDAPPVQSRAGWHPPENTCIMEAVQLHFQVEHDTDQVTLGLAVICACGAAMIHVRVSAYRRRVQGLRA